MLSAQALKKLDDDDLLEYANSEPRSPLTEELASRFDLALYDKYALGIKLSN